MIFTTKNGARLEVGRIPRQEIDRFVAAHPMPEPPTRKEKIFGGVDEDVPVLDDPDYRAAMVDYYIQLGHDEAGLAAQAVTILDWDEDAARGELAELRQIGLGGDDEGDLLRYVVLGDLQDMAGVMELVLYQSTVTERGIAEASRAFAVTWAGRQVEAWHIPGTPGRYSAIFEARQAAQFGNCAWEAFCALPGPEQSAAVAFYRQSLRLDWLKAQK